MNAVAVIFLPLGGVFQRRLTVASLVILQLRQDQGQLVVGQEVGLSVVGIHAGNRLAPIPLTGENPLPEMVVDLSSGHAGLFQLAGDGLLGLLHRQAGELFGVDEPAALAKIILLLKGVLGHVRAVNDLNHGDVMHLGVLKVTLVVAGHGHDRAGAVARQNEVADKHGHLLAVDRVDGVDALQAAAGLGLVQLGTIHVALLHGLVDVRLNRFLVLHPVHQALHDLAVGGKHHEGNAINRLDTGGVDGEFTAAHQLEVHLHTGGFADPVALDLLGGFRPVDLVETFQQLLREGGLVNDPLHHVLLDHGIAAPLGLAVDDLVVAEHGAQLLAPVHGHLNALGVARLVELLEDPLRPLIEGRVGRGDHLRPVVIEAKLLQLSGEGLNVLLGKSVGMMTGIHGVLLRRQAEGVIAHGVQHVVALHPLHAGDDIRRRVALGMTRVQADAGGIREHIQHIVFGLGEIPHVGVEGIMLLPVLVPLGLNFCVIVIHAEHTSQTGCISVSRIYTNSLR